MKKLLKTIRDDIKHYSQDKVSVNKIFVIIYYQGLTAIILYRILNYLHINSKHSVLLKIIYNVLFILLYIPFKNITGLELHPEANLGEKIYIPHGNSIVISKKATIGNGVTIHQNTTLGINYKTKEAPIINDNVFIGANCSIIGGIVIGKNSVVMSNSSVVKDFPESSIIGGVPAKLIKVLDDRNV